jgi:hypothetical protein
MELEKWTNKMRSHNANGIINDIHLYMVKEASAFRIQDGPKVANTTIPGIDASRKHPSFTVELDNHRQVCLARGVLFYLQKCDSLLEVF